VFTSDRLIAAWEAALDAPPYRKAQALLAAAADSPAGESVAGEQAGIGERNRRLLELRAQQFGPELTAVTDCPACGERLEMAIRVTDLWAPYAEDPLVPRTATAGGVQIRYRLPTVADLAAVEGVDRPARALIERCVLGLAGDLPGAALQALPEVEQRAVFEAVSEAMAEADPQADIQLSLVCAACGEAWAAPFDPVAYLWAEVDTWVRRVLREVHVLARAYGWSEAAILAMTEQRRKLYLEMVTE